jgi:signal transduction histidine kinase
MKNSYEAISLIESEQWKQFLESTAAALQINITFIVNGGGGYITVCDACPVCNKKLPSFQAAVQPELGDITRKSAAHGKSAAWDDDTEIFYLNDLYIVVARNYLCGHIDRSFSFRDKVCVAKELLGNFLDILTKQWRDGQRSTELATLHQINHIVLSMFRGEDNALERVVDLILSAAIILFDAAGSWLEYTSEDRHHIVTKGSCSAPAGGEVIKIENSMTAEVISAVIRGTLGIIDPINMERAGVFLDFMVQECVIVFEINHLLKRMESKLAVALGTMDKLVMLVDQRKNICYVNQYASELLDRPIRELVDLPVGELDAPWCECIETETQEIIRGIRDQVNVSLDSKLLDWEVYPLPADHEISGWLIMARDRSDYYRLQELGENIESIVNTSAMLNCIAQEIKNPLSAFKSILDVIKLKVTSPETKEYIELGMTEINRLKQLLDEFLQLGKASVMALQVIDLKTFMEGIVPKLKKKFAGPDFLINKTINTVLPVQVDKRQMTQALFNIVENAYEAVNQTGRVTISLDQLNKDWVEISIHDNGPGIPEKIIDKMFKPYFSTKPDRTGLGLAIAYTIVKNHGGEISAQNHPHGGTCFSILLPSSNKKSIGNISKTEVLLVTDDESIRIPSERVLKSENIKTFTIDRQDNLFYVLDRCSPLVIMIDDSFLDEPILSNLIESIKADYPGTKILIIGKSNQLTTGDGLFFAPKPINYAKLVNTVRILMKRL